jgi:hypothetical protein
LKQSPRFFLSKGTTLVPGKLERLMESEPLWKTRGYALAAVVIALGFWLAPQAYFVPVTRGGDRNGYLLGGKMLAEGNWRGIEPADAYEYLGPHWVKLETGRFALKYPLGLPVVYAVLHGVVGSAHWMAAAHEVSPLLAALGVLGTFFLFRPIVGSCAATGGMILVATSPPTFFFANLPNSHACAFCVAVWGVHCLLQWWRSDLLWQGIAAGLLLGFNVTVRYTEGLLLIPIILVALFAHGWNRKAIMKSLPIFVAWLVLPVSQVSYNLAVLHHATGYALTHESTAFSLGNFAANWQRMLGELGNTMAFLSPVAILGAVLMFRAQRRLAVVLIVWALGTILVYTAYYWTPGEEPGLSYTRFVLTALPALVVMAMWPLQWIARRGIAPLLLVVAIVTAAAVVDMRFAVARAADLKRDNLACEALVRQVLGNVPQGSVIFVDQANAAPLQVAGDYRLYLADLFTARYVNSFATVNADEPQVLQAERAQELFRMLGGRTNAELAEEENRLMTNAIAQGRKIYAALPERECDEFARSFLKDRGWTARAVAGWETDIRWEIIAVTADQKR